MYLSLSRDYYINDKIMKTDISIIGAGIGGLTTALILKQKHFEVKIYEGSAAIKPVGAGIILANNAMQVMKKLGLQEKLEQVGNKLSCMKITDTKLKPISVTDLSFFEQKYQVSNLAIHRGELQKILTESIGYEHINLSKRLLKIEKNDGYNLTFDDDSNLESQVIIGADGIKSIIRNQLFEPTKIRKAAQICWRGIAEIDLPEKYHKELNEAWGKGKRFGFVKINSQKVYWYALINAPKQIDTQMNLLDLFQEFHPDILRIIETTPTNQIIFSEITDLTPTEKWHQNNLCLIGDAAHATTPNLGQGACQAIEDAYILGKCLEENQDINGAFQQYNFRRIKKAHTIVNISWQIGKLAEFDSNLGVWFRNNLMSLIPKSMNMRQMEMIFNIEV
jgi:2-polyprenyl-6-methoxyphenol hydroxylase-like FAD-dependent oxidoreductase